MRTVLAGGLIIAALAPCPAAAARTSVAAALLGLERSGAITPAAYAQDRATYVAAQRVKLSVYRDGRKATEDEDQD